MLFIHGIGHFHPENQIDNLFFQDLGIGTDPAWILERVGIRSRRTVLPLDYIVQTKNENPSLASQVSLYTNAQTGAQAANLAMKRAGISPNQIGMVISGGCSPEYLIPAEACILASELNLEATAFDLSSACSSFAAQIHFLRGMRTESLPDFILLMSCENNTRSVDYRDRGTAILWGDCSAATIVSKKVPSKMRVTLSTLSSDPSGWMKVKIPAGGHFSQSGAQVQSFAIRKTLATLEILQKQAHSGFKQNYFIGHQANLRMLNQVCEKARISKQMHLHNVEDFGNCGAAGAPSVLSQNWDRFQSGDQITVALVGSGLTWSGFVVQVD